MKETLWLRVGLLLIRISFMKYSTILREDYGIEPEENICVLDTVIDVNGKEVFNLLQDTDPKDA